ncbi:MAG: Holliday junction branch migration protein RuvA [Micrococcales bacterium]|nr:Holliday junction branch migration protein RuvA [Micrococcales bacterium]
MISSVRGTVLATAASSVVIDVGGIGYLVTVTSQHALALRVGDQALVRTSLIVREDDLSLFGFATADEQAVFDLLRGVGGVGPKSALGVLSALSPAQIARAVATEDDGAFRTVSGIGPKTAKLITISLAGKMLEFLGTGTDAPTPRPNAGDAARSSVLAALTGLGWPERAAASALDEVLADEPAATGVPTLLRLCLARLGPAPHPAPSSTR